MSCAVLCQIAPLQYLYRSSLRNLAGLTCRIFLSQWSPNGDTRLICPAQDYLICSRVADQVYDTCLFLTNMLFLLSLYVMLSILLYILMRAAASLFCALLVSVHVYAPYAIGNTHELYTCHFRQMARLLLKRPGDLPRFFFVSL